VKHCDKGPETACFCSIVLSTGARASSFFKAMTATFVVGNTYYGSLAVAHCAFPVVCTKRTEKSAWFEHANSEAYKPARAKIHKWSDGAESSTFHGWRIYADSIKNNGWDMQLV
jgi:hypothetical protein